MGSGPFSVGRSGVSRPLRLDYPGALWHVTARGNERRPIYRDPEDYTAFSEVLGQTVSRYRWRLLAYVLMPNHYHLVVETPVASLSRGMRQLGGVYTQRFNRKWSRCGHLFQGRFFSLHVERETHLLELGRYVALNPVRAKLVKRPEEWGWGSYRALAGLEPPPDFLAAEWVREGFESRRTTAGRAFAEFVRRPNDYEPWTRVRHQVYLGGESFCSDRLDQARRAGARRGVPARQSRGLAVAPEDVLARVVAVAAEAPEDRRRRNLVAVLLRDEALATWAEVGRAVDLSEEGARSAVRAAHAAIASDPRLRQELEALRAEVLGQHTAG